MVPCLKDGEDGYVCDGRRSVFVLQSVSDHFSTLPDEGVFEGDGYINGRLDPDGQQEYLAYQAEALRCRQKTFDETKPKAPGWCLGGG